MPRGPTAVAAIAIALALSGCQASEVSRAVGARCDEKAECDERCLPPSDAFPDGFCTLSCLDDGDCPSGTDCVDVAGGVCLFPCVDDDDCGFLGERWTCQVEEALPPADDEVTVCIGSEQ